jgi:hypothetical protein
LLVEFGDAAIQLSMQVLRHLLPPIVVVSLPRHTSSSNLLLEPIHPAFHSMQTSIDLASPRARSIVSALAELLHHPCSSPGREYSLFKSISLYPQLLETVI